MTPTAHLRAALEKHGVAFREPLRLLTETYPSLHAAILEAMEAYRAEALAEVEAWVRDHSYTIHAGSPVVYRTDLQAKLRALKDIQ